MEVQVRQRPTEKSIDQHQRKLTTNEEVRQCTMMDDESGESMEPMEEVPLIKLGKAELERLVRG